MCIKQAFSLSLELILVPGKHMAIFFYFIAGEVILHIRFIYPCLDVDDLFSIII